MFCTYVVSTTFSSSYFLLLFSNYKLLFCWALIMTHEATEMAHQITWTIDAYKARLLAIQQHNLNTNCSGHISQPVVPVVQFYNILDNIFWHIFRTWQITKRCCRREVLGFNPFKAIWILAAWIPSLKQNIKSQTHGNSEQYYLMLHTRTIWHNLLCRMHWWGLFLMLYVLEYSIFSVSIDKV